MDTQMIVDGDADTPAPIEIKSCHAPLIESM